MRVISSSYLSVIATVNKKLPLEPYLGYEKLL